MIAKISRGWRVGGLVRYLMGPGRFNEHTNQHVVASWDGAPQMHQPTGTPSGGFDVEKLASDLALPAVAAGIPQTEPARVAGSKVPRGPVWHCSLRNSSGDRPLTDEEWSEVVTDLMERSGIAPRGDLGACRWVAIRHAEDHVHIAAVLVRQDTGKRVHPRNDYLRAREVCKEAEVRFGLTPTAAVDRTTAEPSTRAEMEKAQRQGKDETSREWLRRAVRVAAVQAQDPEEFFRRLADQRVLVRPKEMPAGQLVGYAVAAPGDENAEGLPVWFSGRGLARDLSLPQLLARWASAPEPAAAIPPGPGERSTIGRAERAAAVDDAISSIEHATAMIAAGDTAAVPAIAHAVGDMIQAVCAVTNRRSSAVAAVPWAAADVFDRAARSPQVGQPLRWDPVASQLRTAAWRLIAVRGLTGRGGEGGVGQLVVGLASLVAEIAAYREQQRCLLQASAARRSAQVLREVGAGAAGRRSGTAGPGRDPRAPGASGQGPGRNSEAGTGRVVGPAPEEHDIGRGRKR